MADLTAHGYQPTDAPDLVNGDYKKMLADLQALNTQVGDMVQQIATLVSNDSTMSGQISALQQENTTQDGEIQSLQDSLSHISNGWDTQDFSSRDFNDINSHIGAVYTRDTWSEAQNGPVGADSYGYLFSLVMGTSSLQIFLSQTNRTTNLAMMRSRYSGKANWEAWRAV